MVRLDVQMGRRSKGQVQNQTRERLAPTHIITDRMP
jgi:hypothetical protein